MVRKRMPKYGIIDILRAILAYILAKYQYFLMKPGLCCEISSTYSWHKFVRKYLNISLEIFRYSEVQMSYRVGGLFLCNSSVTIIVFCWLLLPAHASHLTNNFILLHIGDKVHATSIWTFESEIMYDLQMCV